tara:strand:- start:1203 stop:1337 length:135 start_codon:yes stop_codon:yes gene_type:complete
LNTKNIYKKLNTLLTELQTLTGVSDEELEEFIRILDLTNFEENN